MAVTGEEKRLWSRLNSELRDMLGPYIVGCGMSDVIDCINKSGGILDTMREIIRGREGTLGNGKAGVGVRGMSEILSGVSSFSDVDFLEKYVESREDLFCFSICLSDISMLPRGGFLWIGDSALTKYTQGLCGDLASVLGNRLEHEWKKAK